MAFLIRGQLCYKPKRRIVKKVETIEYRERYEKHVDGRAVYNSIGKLCWVWKVNGSRKST
jgi:hypothetical protein